MQKHLEDRLFLEFPKILKKSHLDRGKIYVEDGWFQILRALLLTVDYYLERENISLYFVNIEAKWGELRVQYFYPKEFMTPTSQNISFIEGIISSTTFLSKMTCEFCGRTGYSSKPRIYMGQDYTLCKKHAKEKDYVPIHEIDYEIDGIQF